MGKTKAGDKQRKTRRSATTHPTWVVDGRPGQTYTGQQLKQALTIFCCGRRVVKARRGFDWGCRDSWRLATGIVRRPSLPYAGWCYNATTLLTVIVVGGVSFPLALLAYSTDLYFLYYSSTTPLSILYYFSHYEYCRLRRRFISSLLWSHVRTWLGVGHVACDALNTNISITPTIYLSLIMLIYLAIVIRSE